MILDYPDHTLLFPKKGGNSSFFFFRLYITQLSLAVLYRIAEQIFLLCQP